LRPRGNCFVSDCQVCHDVCCTTIQTLHDNEGVSGRFARLRRTSDIGYEGHRDAGQAEEVDYSHTKRRAVAGPWRSPSRPPGDAEDARPLTHITEYSSSLPRCHQPQRGRHAECWSLPSMVFSGLHLSTISAYMLGAIHGSRCMQTSHARYVSWLLRRERCQGPPCRQLDGASRPPILISARF